MSKNLYSYKEVDKFIEKLPKHYTIIKIDGTLVDGYICLSNSEYYWNFEFREVYLNEWSSALSMRRFGKVSKRMQKTIDRVLESNEQ